MQRSWSEVPSLGPAPVLLRPRSACWSARPWDPSPSSVPQSPAVPTRRWGAPVPDLPLCPQLPAATVSGGGALGTRRGSGRPPETHAVVRTQTQARVRLRVHTYVCTYTRTHTRRGTHVCTDSPRSPDEGSAGIHHSHRAETRAVAPLLPSWPRGQKGHPPRRPKGRLAENQGGHSYDLLEGSSQHPHPQKGAGVICPRVVRVR